MASLVVTLVRTSKLSPDSPERDRHATQRPSRASCGLLWRPWHCESETGRRHFQFNVSVTTTASETNLLFSITHFAANSCALSQPYRNTVNAPYSSPNIIRIIKSRRMKWAACGRWKMLIGFWWESQKERDYWKELDVGKAIPATGREGP
jgi:hypothetical protein